MNKYKIGLILVLFIFSIGAVCASDINDTSELTADDSASTGTFTDLKNNISNSANEFNMHSDYKFNEETDKDFLDPKKNNSIKINQTNFVINGNNHTIDADNKGIPTIFNLEGLNVTINDLTIKNVFNIGIYSKSNLTLNNVKFFDSGKNNTPVIYSLSNLTLNKCIMKNISADGITIYSGSLLAVKDSIFTNSKAKTYGFINAEIGTAILENCVFENIEAKYGSALYFSGIELLVENCLFNNLYSNITGGAIVVKGIPMTNTTKKEYPYETQVIIKNSLFNNVSSEKNGGAIFADMGGMYYNIEDKGNIAGNMMIINSNFTDCKSEFGGAILHLNGNLQLTNIIFINNKATVSGGAVYTSYADVVMENCIFKDNSALKYGGAIYSELNRTGMDNCIFISNKVEEASEFNPSTIYTYDNGLYIRNSFFNNSKESVSSIFTKEFVDDNNIWNNDKFYTNLTIYPIAYNDEGLKLNLINNTINFTDLPARFDLRDWGWITPVKNQGMMGACWAFSTLAALESALLKATGTAYDLSENNVQNSELAYSRYGSTVNL